MVDFGGRWDKFLPLCEFSYNNIYQSIIDMEPFEALYESVFLSRIGLVLGWRFETFLGRFSEGC